MKRINITRVIIEKTRYTIFIKDDNGNKDFGMFKLERELNTPYKKRVIYNLAYSYTNKYVRDIIIESYYFRFYNKRHWMWVDDDFQLYLHTSHLNTP